MCVNEELKLKIRQRLASQSDMLSKYWYIVE